MKWNNNTKEEDIRRDQRKAAKPVKLFPFFFMFSISFSTLVSFAIYQLNCRQSCCWCCGGCCCSCWCCCCCCCCCCLLMVCLLLCIQTFKTCLRTPTSAQNCWTNASSCLWNRHPTLSAKANILSFCSAVNFVRNLFFNTTTGGGSPAVILSSLDDSVVVPPLPLALPPKAIAAEYDPGAAWDGLGGKPMGYGRLWWWAWG